MTQDADSASADSMSSVNPGEVRRGLLRRADKVMTKEEVDGFLARAFCGRTATVGADGYPYVVPNLFVWREGKVHLHTARYEGHFVANVRHSDRVSFEVDEPGLIYPYGHVECDTSVSYRSVIIFGRIRILDDEADKARFYEGFLAKYAPPDSWNREKGSFPRLASTIVYEIAPEIVTGKEGKLPPLADQWPNSNHLSGSPGWKPKVAGS
jgi:nitroimidazol reductase NimA-like FMN-containing flavoprotein (pyridoxamine 5'-phosphate oxidase superfamily)